VAQQLGYRFVDDEIVSRAAERTGMPTEIVADAEQRRSLARRILEAMVSAPGGDPIGYTPNVEAFNPASTSEAVIRDVIEEVAAEDNVVINAHGSAMQLGRRAGVLRVLITGSADVRARRVMDEAGLNQSQAERALNDSDKERRDYFKRFYQINDELPTHYDLTINTDQIDFDKAVALIVAPL